MQVGVNNNHDIHGNANNDEDYDYPLPHPHYLHLIRNLPARAI